MINITITSKEDLGELHEFISDHPVSRYFIQGEGRYITLLASGKDIQFFADLADRYADSFNYRIYVEWDANQDTMRLGGLTDGIA